MQEGSLPIWIVPCWLSDERSRLNFGRVVEVVHMIQDRRLSQRIVDVSALELARHSRGVANNSTESFSERTSERIVDVPVPRFGKSSLKSLVVVAPRTSTIMADCEKWRVVVMTRGLTR